MSSSTADADDEADAALSYKPGVHRYQELLPEKRKKLFELRQRELNPCLKVRYFTFIRIPACVTADGLCACLGI